MKDSIKQEQSQMNLSSAERENARPKAKLNTNSNAYIIIYSTILVIIVAFLLAFVSSSLKDKQEANVKLDKEKQVLNSLNLRDKSDDEAHAL